MTRPLLRQAVASGRDAIIAARFGGQPMPACPYRRGSTHARYWQWGVEQAERQAAKLLEIGA